MSKIAFLTLGCKLNYAETSTYQRGFVKAGLELVPWREKADVYLINTCSVTAMADTKSRNLIRKVHRINPEAMIIVTGCSAQLRSDEISEIEGVTRIFGAGDKPLVVSETLALLSHGQGGGANMAAGACWNSADGQDSINGEDKCNGANEDSKGEAVFGAYSSGERTRSFLKVQDGCDNFCRYCTVPFARGHSRNIPICECVRYAREIAASGIKEIVLTGVNTGDYGRTTGESFLDLLKALNEVEGIERYRISSIEPNLLGDDIIEWIASGKSKFQPHFHIPLQSGCDEILEAMGRHYNCDFFESRIEFIRSRLEGPGKPLVFFGIDLMVGLPGESEERFERSVKFLKRIRPAFIHVFPYSRRPGTPAAEMPGQVAEKEKARRVAVIEELCGELHSSFVEANRGVRETVLWESSNRKGMMEGYTGNYIRLTQPFDKLRAGRLEEVII